MPVFPFDKHQHNRRLLRTAWAAGLVWRGADSGKTGRLRAQRQRIGPMSIVDRSVEFARALSRYRGALARGTAMTGSTNRTCSSNSDLFIMPWALDRMEGMA